MSLSYINWSPDPEMFHLFGFAIRYYSLLFLSGIGSSILVLRWLYNKENIPLAHLDKLTSYGIIGILLGARLGHCIFYQPDYYLANPLEIFFPIHIDVQGQISFIGYQGLASHGGALGLIIAIWLYARKTGDSMLKTIDLIAIVTGLAGGFIRLANFMNSEIIGIPTTKPWGVVFEQVDRLPRHPAQLYEAVCYFFIFGTMIFLYKRKRNRLRRGFYFGLFISLTFFVRFLIEFIKENQVDFEKEIYLNMGQLLSIPYVLIGIIFILYSFKKPTNSHSTNSTN